jgi:hypothetical protein
MRWGERFVRALPWVAFAGLSLAVAPRLAGFPGAFEAFAFEHVPHRIATLAAVACAALSVLTALACCRRRPLGQVLLSSVSFPLLFGVLVLLWSWRLSTLEWALDESVWILVAHAAAFQLAAFASPRARLGVALGGWASARILATTLSGGYSSGCLAFWGPVVRDSALVASGMMELLSACLVCVAAIMVFRAARRSERGEALAFLALAVFAASRAGVGGLTAYVFDLDPSRSFAASAIEPHLAVVTTVELGGAGVACILVAYTLGRHLLGSSTSVSVVRIVPVVGVVLLAGSAATDPRSVSADGLVSARWERFGIQPHVVDLGASSVQDGSVVMAHLVVEASGAMHFARAGGAFEPLHGRMPPVDSYVAISMDRRASRQVLEQVLRRTRGTPRFFWVRSPNSPRSPREASRRWPLLDGPYRAIGACDEPLVGEAPSDTFARWSTTRCGPAFGLFTAYDHRQRGSVSERWPFGPRGQPLAPPHLWLVLLLGGLLGVVPIVFAARRTMARLQGLVRLGPAGPGAPPLVPWASDASWGWGHGPTAYRGSVVVGRGPRSRAEAAKRLAARGWRASRTLLFVLLGVLALPVLLTGTAFLLGLVSWG